MIEALFHASLDELKHLDGIIMSTNALHPPIPDVPLLLPDSFIGILSLMAVVCHMLLDLLSSIKEAIIVLKLSLKVDLLHIAVVYFSRRSPVSLDALNLLSPPGPSLDLLDYFFCMLHLVCLDPLFPFGLVIEIHGHLSFHLLLHFESVLLPSLQISQHLLLCVPLDVLALLHVLELIR